MRVHVAFTPEEEAAAPPGILVDVVRVTWWCRRKANGTNSVLQLHRSLDPLLVEGAFE